ncbi:hypothetical protein HG530_005592 [Fusarium avenaceum]|nr:hypothetical protein HG530_005592 [Fusarium avenaceum]
MMLGQLTKTGGQDDCNSSTKLHTETSSGRVKSQTVTKVAHDVVSVGPDTKSNTGTTKAPIQLVLIINHSENLQNPDWDRRFATLETTGAPNLVDGSIRTDSVGDIVGTVGERGCTGSHDLHEGVEVFGTVVVVRDVCMDFVKVASEDTLLVLHGDDILVDTREESLLEAAARLGFNTFIDIRGVGRNRLVLVLSFVVLVLAHKLIATLTTSTSKTLEFFTGEVALVEILDTTNGTLRLSGRRRTLEKERTLSNVPPAELPVVNNDNTVQPRKEEDGDDESPGGTYTDDHTSGFGVVELNLDATTLPDDKHGEKGSSDAKVNGGKEKTLPDRVASEHDTIFSDHKDDSSKCTRQTRSDNPSEEHRNNTRADAFVKLSPVNTVGTNESNTHSNDTSHDGRGGDNSTHHTEHEKSWIGFELVNVDDLGTDSISDTSTYTNGSSEFENGSEGHGLDVTDRSRGDRSSPRVGNIVGTWDVSIVWESA